ncbi:uncharacterized protein EI90DRAFT_3041191 [Cantharellus anzutake]|uniref:uncharacterized protein n=1 Tax=Cantharellus anzutake TaxID=1750568 RepID=UPI001906F7F1|nr:uncharacterized protein EI90DRAFT_3041191 [Cantharellus anzutake]KAF8337972.1 hypothetical protein EI90DRAFT_3041191 [Cantharellus anzutake]
MHCVWSIWDIVEEIASYLDGLSTLRLGSTCRTLCSLCMDAKWGGPLPLKPFMQLLPQDLVELRALPKEVGSWKGS